MAKKVKADNVEDFRSKGLTVLIALAIVVSVAGTLITLNSVSHGITGYATDSETGTAQFTVAALTQITLDDSTVNFGTCTLNSSADSTYDSNASNGNSLETGDSGTCGGTFPDRMHLENTGNKFVNLTIKANISATNYIDASGNAGSFYYVGINDESNSCNATLQSTFANFTAANTNYPLCANFTPINTADEMYIAFRVKLPPDTQEGVKSALITITGEDCAQ